MSGQADDFVFLRHNRGAEASGDGETKSAQRGSVVWRVGKAGGGRGGGANALTPSPKVDPVARPWERPESNPSAHATIRGYV